jgi:hypothetical protein
MGPLSATWEPSDGFESHPLKPPRQKLSNPSATIMVNPEERMRTTPSSREVVRSPTNVNRGGNIGPTTTI